MKNWILLGLVLSSVAVACVTHRVTVDGREYEIRRDVCCMELAGSTEEAACLERGKSEPDCRYGPGLSCYGTEPPEEEQREEARARETCQVGCACVCESDRVACSQVP